MIPIKSESEQEAMRKAGRIAARVLSDVAAFIKPGVTTKEVDEYCAERIASYDAKSAFLGYRGYPGHLCVSVNDEVVHGIGGARRLRVGDIVSLDVGVYYKGF
ncbi:MAG: M24 family metallopeptidase, partial [Verrucomicrobia bacterium]|nr:M24 family metallopeptidase [Verrucomicrobiota bacterium]